MIRSRAFRFFEEFLPRSACFVEGAATPASGGGSPGPAPSSSPAPQAPPEPGGSGSSTGGAEPASNIPNASMSAFEGMDDDLDFVDLGTEATEDGSGAPTPQEPATPAPVVPPSATPAPAAPAVVAPVAPAAPAPAPSAQPLSARDELAQAAEGFKTNFKELQQWATGELFVLSQEERDALDTDATGAIPSIMARVYTQAVMAASNMMNNLVPRLISEGVVQQQAKTARSTEAAQQFWTTNSDLKQDQHGDAMTRWARAFRSQNPTASRADAIKFVGNAVRAEFGLPPLGTQAAPAARRAVPFAPATPGVRAQQSAPVELPWDGLDQDFDVE